MASGRGYESVCVSAGRVGSQMVVPLRGDEHDYRHLKPMGDLGQITPLVSDWTSPFHQ